MPVGACLCLTVLPVLAIPNERLRPRRFAAEGRRRRARSLVAVAAAVAVVVVVVAAQLWSLSSPPTSRVVHVTSRRAFSLSL